MACLEVDFFFFFWIVNVGEDCPVFDGMYQFCQFSAGGSLGKKNRIECSSSDKLILNVVQ